MMDVRTPKLPALLRTGVIVVGAGAAAWLSLAVTLSQVLAERNPAAALAWWPNASARAALSVEVMGENPTQQDAARARALAVAALRRSAAVVPAYRSLAIAAAALGDEKTTIALARASERLSRRDFQTQLMLIEISVRADDLAAALTHYDRVLRVRLAAQDLLFPVLVQAANDPEIARLLLGFLAPRPIYWSALTAQIIANMGDMANLGAFLAGLKLDPRIDMDQALLKRGMERLAASGAYAEAYRLYLSAARDKTPALLRDGDFNEDGGLAPFDWTLAEGPDLQAAVAPGADGDRVLFITAHAGRGEAARQLVLLAPGAYRLSAVLGEAPEDKASRPTIVIACANTAQVLTTVVAEGAAASPLRIAGEFIVPAACPAQLVEVTATGSLDGGNQTPWIDKIMIERR